MSQRTNISAGGAFEEVFGYSRAVRFGNQLFISGTCAPPAHEKDDAYLQTKAILEVVSGVLEKANLKLTDVVKTVVYVRDMNDAELVAKAHKEVFDSIRPASTIVQVGSMLRMWQRVEIETYAISA